MRVRLILCAHTGTERSKNKPHFELEIEKCKLHIGKSEMRNALRREGRVGILVAAKLGRFFFERTGMLWQELTAAQFPTAVAQEFYDRCDGVGK